MSPAFRDLPDAIAPGDSFPNAWRSIERARGALLALENQLLALEIIEFFKREPRLLSFSFDIRHEGQPYEICAVRANDQFEYHLQSPHDTGLDATLSELSRWLTARLRGRLNRSWQSRRFERPREPQSLIDGLMAQFLSPEELALWQAAMISGATASSRPASPKAI